jgi:hypothetical protein
VIWETARSRNDYRGSGLVQYMFHDLDILRDGGDNSLRRDF